MGLIVGGAIALIGVALATASPGGGWLTAAVRVYMPRRMCMFYEGDVVWTHAVSDAVIALSYFSIPVALAHFVRRRGDVKFSGVFWLFAAFILLCGITHVFGFSALWMPLYRLDGWVKALCAGVSASTAVVLWKIMPALVALPSPSQLEAVNDQLRTLSGDLEVRVAQRTAELAAAAEQEAQLRHEAERLNRLKDEFLGTLGHELRTPLNSVLGWAQILRTEGSGDPATVAEATEIIERNVRAQAHLVDDLLDVSRILAGRMRLDLEQTTLAEIVRGAIDVVRPAAEARHVELYVEDGGGLERDLVVDVDRLRQVVWNLLSNAVKFTHRGGHVTVKAVLDESGVQLEVTDDGEGIDPQFLPHLFDAFAQADAGATRRKGGLGLGLNIVKRIVELHGGRVEAESPGRGMGSTFRVILPISSVVPTDHDDEPRSADTVALSRSPDGGGALVGLRLLIVEDEEDSRRMLARALRAQGADVIVAADATEAIEALAAEGERLDAMVSDVGMPGLSGYDLIRQVREAEAEGPRLPALALTAYARREDRREALAAGFDDHVPKPVEHPELVRRLLAMVGGR